MKKCVVTGASGLLGRAIVKHFEERSWALLKLSCTRRMAGMSQVDLNDTVTVENMIKDWKPDVIIHCAAKRDLNSVEQFYDGARALNISCSKELARMAKELNAVFLFISTDNVFDGTNPPYAESDEPHPINKYGETKVEAENEVMTVNPSSCILRCPLLYGGDMYAGESDVSSLIKNIRSEQSSRVSNYEVYYPAHTRDVASICFRICEMKMKNPSLNSIFHWSGLEALTKYDMVKAIANAFWCPFQHIRPINTCRERNNIRIPKDPKLSCERLNSLDIGHHTFFEMGVREEYEDFMDEDYAGVHRFQLPYDMEN